MADNMIWITKLSDRELVAKLKAHGESPLPCTNATRATLQRRLCDAVKAGGPPPFKPAMPMPVKVASAVVPAATDGSDVPAVVEPANDGAVAAPHTPTDPLQTATDDSDVSVVVAPANDGAVAAPHTPTDPLQTCDASALQTISVEEIVKIVQLCVFAEDTFEAVFDSTLPHHH